VTVAARRYRQPSALQDLAAMIDGQLSGGDLSGLPRCGARVRLRRLGVDDLPAFQAHRADSELGRWQGWSLTSREATLAFLADMQHAEAWVVGRWFQLAIEEVASGRLLGDFGVCVHGDGSAEIGITLARDAQGRGLATEAIGLLISLLFERPGIDRVRGITDARHAASARLLARAGLRHMHTAQAEFRGEACIEWTFERERAPVELRPAVAADAAALAAFAAHSFEATYGDLNRPEDTHAFISTAYAPAVLGAEIADPAVTTLLLRVEGCLLGFAQVQRKAPPPCVVASQGMTQALDRFYIDARWHGCGLAARLLAAVVDAALRQGAAALWLTVWERNPRARAFYLKQGFVDVGQTVFVVGEDHQSDRVMWLDLAGSSPAG
jgi:RimJ/RimL family protein N-acetyltransferase